MRKLFPALFLVFLVMVSFIESTHAHEQSCDAACPAVCLGGACGVYCGDSGSARAAAPERTASRVAFCSVCVFMGRLSQDDIFHPPVV